VEFQARKTCIVKIDFGKSKENDFFPKAFLIMLNTPLNSPTRGGVFTSSRPPSAMDARFDEEVTFYIIQYSALSKRPLGKNHFLLTYQNLSSQINI
jgi:hypothetical protein